MLIVEDEMVIALEIESQLRELGYSSFDYADSPTRRFGRHVSSGRTW
ncbi:hypothetical protein [Caulobacter sp. CCH9-E1]|nr:hypothetical protein [Caulobacter sp. CCH9-E1]